LEARTDRLFNAFLVLQSRKNVLSETELERLHNRWLALELLAGGLPQAEVSRRTD